MDNNYQNPQQDYNLADDLNSLAQYTPADKGRRFVNWLVDNLLMQYVLGFATGYLLALLFLEIAPDFLYDVVNEPPGSMNYLLYVYIVAIFNYLVYYTLCEKLFRGYTLGKLLSGTRAIRKDGTELTWRDAFLRSLSRLVPFEAFSGLGDEPWHDTWTNTTVISAR